VLCFDHTSTSSCITSSYMFSKEHTTPDICLTRDLYRPTESPEIKTSQFPGLESPGNRIGPAEPWKSQVILQ